MYGGFKIRLRNLLLLQHIGLGDPSVEVPPLSSTFAFSVAFIHIPLSLPVLLYHGRSGRFLKSSFYYPRNLVN